MNVQKVTPDGVVNVFATSEDLAQRDADIAAKAAYTAPDARVARVTALVNDLFQSPDPEARLVACLLREFAIDIAGTQGLTSEQYRDVLIKRLTA